MSDVRIERVVERVQLCVGTLGPEQRKEPRYQVMYYTYLASGRRLAYTPSVERVASQLKTHETQPVSFANFAIF